MQLVQCGTGVFKGQSETSWFQVQKWDQLLLIFKEGPAAFAKRL